MRIIAQVQNAEGTHNVTLQTDGNAHAIESDIMDLMRHTDSMAEIQNTLRTGAPVRLDRVVGQPV